jgi:plastocyanin
MRLARSLALIVAASAMAITIAACATYDPGWTYAPPSATPIASADASASAAPSDGGSSAAPSSSPSGPVLEISAVAIQFDTDTLTAPANTAFQLAFQNDDAGIPHNVAIRDAAGADMFTGEIFNGIDKRTYDVPPLAAGTYQFLCTVHPTMTGTLTVQ